MALPLAPSRTRLPDASRVDYANPEEVKTYMASLVESLTVALAQRAVMAQAQPSRLFISPNGTAYEQTVDDAGVTHVVKKRDALP